MENQQNDDEVFWKNSATLLFMVEKYYRELKLKKPVWGKITPTVIKYIASKALLQVVQHIAEDVATIKNNEAIGDAAISKLIEAETNVPLSNSGAPLQSQISPSSIDKEEISQDKLLEYQQCLVEAQSISRDIYPKLLHFWETVPSIIREKLKADIVKALSHRAETLTKGSFLITDDSEEVVSDGESEDESNLENSITTKELDTRFHLRTQQYKTQTKIAQLLNNKACSGTFNLCENSLTNLINSLQQWILIMEIS